MRRCHEIANIRHNHSYTKKCKIIPSLIQVRRSAGTARRTQWAPQVDESLLAMGVPSTAPRAATESCQLSSDVNAVRAMSVHARKLIVDVVVVARAVVVVADCVGGSVGEPVDCADVLLVVVVLLEPSRHPHAQLG